MLNRNKMNLKFDKISFRLFCLLLSVFYLMVSCDTKTSPTNENYEAIAFMGNGEEIQLGNNLYMESQKIGFILFIYHDTIFQAKIDSSETTYSYIVKNDKLLDSIKETFKRYGKTTLKKQLVSMKTNGYSGTCSPDSYFLFGSNTKINFGLFYYMDYYDLIRRARPKEITIPEQKIPKIYSTIYHTLNSKIWDYYMSNDYYYKNVRTYGKIDFFKIQKEKGNTHNTK